MSALFSIVIPVYNVKEYLAACVESVLSQTFTEYEVLLIDDGSTDGSGEICDELCKTSDRIRVIHQKNGGLSEARNTGIRNAKGDYLFFLDSDDFLSTPTALEELAAPLQKTNPDLLLYSTTEYAEDGKTILFSHGNPPISEQTLYQAEDVLDALYEAGDIWVTMAQTKLLRREFCLQKGLFFQSGIYHEDDEWISRVLAANPTLSVSSSAVYGYRHRPNSIVTTTDTKKIEKRILDRISIGASMLQSNQAKDHPTFCRYAARYFWGALCQIKTLPKERQKILFGEVGQYRSAFNRFRYTRSIKWRLCASMQRVLGTSATVSILRKA